MQKTMGNSTPWKGATQGDSNAVFPPESVEVMDLHPGFNGTGHEPGDLAAEVENRAGGE